MNKSNLLTIGISLIVLITVTVVLLMVLLPQPSVVIDASMSEYETIKKSDYVYEQTKDLTREALVKEYTITNEQMDKFRKTNQYISGNSDPFTPYGSSDKTTTNSTNKNNSNSSNSSNNNSNSSTNKGNTSNSNTSTSDETTQKITNSNGGIANPPSTKK